MRPTTVLALLVTLLLWGSAFAGIRGIRDAYSPGQLALLRFLIASLAMLPVAWASQIPRPNRTDLRRFLLLGLFGVALYHFALNFGQRTVDAGTACFIINLSPVFTAVLATALLGERLRWHGWLGLSLSMTGVGLIAFAQTGGLNPGWGVLAVLAAAVCSAIFIVCQKPLLVRLSPIAVVSYSTWIGTGLLLVFAPGLPSAIAQAPPAATWTVVYLGVFPGALAYVTWAIVLKHLPATRATSLLYASPLVAIAAGYLWLGEVPGLQALVGGMMALGGAIVVNARPVGAPILTRDSPPLG